MAEKNPKAEALSAISLDFLEKLHLDYGRDPESVPPDWHRFFRGLEADGSPGAQAKKPSFQPGDEPGPRTGANGKAAARAPDAEVALLQDRVHHLVQAFRICGHLAADVNPLEAPGRRPPDLDPEFHGLSESHLDQRFPVQIGRGPEVLTLHQIVSRMCNTYCRTVGVEFMHIMDASVRAWLIERMEGTENRIALQAGQKIRMLSRLTEAAVFEEFLQRKFIGAKSFSLEGAEALVPLLDFAVDKAAAQGVREVVLAMAHRGRLNVLATVLGKKPREIFREFEDRDPKLHLGRGDVKYHLGYSADRETSSGRAIHLSLCFNPSHLEAVNPVAMGRVRAKQDRAGDAERRRCLGILIHGDASFAGQGVIQEILNMSRLPAYSVGGILHVIVNNQIGFTTSPGEGRSGPYATDAARMLDIPIFHVNGDDPEAVAHVVDLAADFWAEFGRDVVIDMYCYRRRGHNEGDEPAFTQPLMYHEVERKKPLHQAYLDRLAGRGEVSEEQSAGMTEGCRAWLDEELSCAREESPPPAPTPLRGIWQGYFGGPEKNAKEADTRVEAGRLADLLERQTRLPEDFHPHRKIVRAIGRRKKMARGEAPLDWSAAEALAFATLAAEGVRIRMSGQDTARGTFSQRHALLFDYEDGRPYAPLQNIEEGQAPVEVYNSPLSEFGVLGFEYGYSLDYPEALVLWEAQFGDFCNAAQVIVDQFVASAEDKWRRLSGLVLLLPHGFEGMGPEHSSARLERFMALAAEDNIQIACPTTPAQYFHCLRRQALRKWRKPLVVMTPKSLLRHPRSSSAIEDLSGGGFRRIIPDSGAQGEGTARVLLCSGKIFFELEEARERLGRKDVAILRVEQLYPLPEDVLHSALAPYPGGTPAIWVQEEPENMGAWRTLRARFGETLLGRLPFYGVSRPASASPATGSLSSHRLEQERVIMRAFADAHA